MLNKPISYKFIPALATLLCACAPAQAVNFHIGFDFPIGRPVRPVYPVYTVPVYVAPARPCYSVTDSLIGEIQHDFETLHRFMHKDCHGDLSCLSRTIKHNWVSWARGYRNAFGMSRYELETLSDELREIVYALRRAHSAKLSVCNYEYVELRTAMMNIADIVGSCHRYRTSDLRDVTMYLSQIQRILAHS